MHNNRATLRLRFVGVAYAHKPVGGGYVQLLVYKKKDYYCLCAAEGEGNPNTKAAVEALGTLVEAGDIKKYAQKATTIADYEHAKDFFEKEFDLFKPWYWFKYGV